MSILVKYRWVLLAIVIGSCIYGSFYIPIALQANNDLELWFDKSDPALQAYYEFQEAFGNDRIIGLAFKEEGGILQLACLRKIKRVQERLEKLEGVDHVVSIVNAKDFRKIANETTITMQFSSWFNDPLNMVQPKIAQQILTSPLYANRLINDIGNVTLVVIHLKSFDLVHSKMDKIIPRIKSVCNEELGAANVHLSGSDILNFGLNELSRRDFIKFTGLSYLVMFLIIALFYRRTIYVILSFLIAFTTIWLTFSVYGYFGYGLNIFTVMTPTLVIVISIMMSMHIFNEFESLSAYAFENRKEKTIHCLKEIIRPCLYAALTTMIGFLSLLSSSTAVIKEFGWLTSVGCMLAFVLAFAWSGIVLPYVSIKIPAVNRTHNLGQAVSNFSGFILKNSTTFLFLSIFIFVVSIIGILNIKIDMDPMGFFPSDHSVAKDHAFMQNNWGDYYPIDIVLQTEGTLEIDDKAVISALINFDARVVEKKLARSTFSYVQVMDRFATVRYGKTLNEIVKTPILISNFKKSFNNLVENKSDFLVTEDHKKARITVTGPFQSIRKLEESITELNKIGKDVFNNSASITVSGYPALFVKIMNTAFDSMKFSLIIALLLVFLVMFLLLRNIKIAIVAIIVNVFPVLVMLGFLGFSNINLDLATCTIAAIILGIAIDDTIHILYRYLRERKADVPVAEALKNTHFHIGRVVVLTSVVLFAGFSILLLASLKTVFYFGLLSLIAVVAILYGDIILLTLLLKKWN